MRSFILTSWLVGLALASPFDHSVPELDASMPSESDQLSEMFDLVESGLSREHEGRVLMLTVTKTKYTSTTESTSVTKTTKAACYTASTTIPDCSTYVPEIPTTTEAETTTVARKRKHNKHNKHSKNKKNHKKNHSTQKERFQHLVNPYPDAVVTRRDGLPADIWDLLTPTPVIVDDEQTEVDADSFDGVLDETESLSSGNLNWREVMVEGLSSCGRSGKRPRLLNVSKTTSTKTITMTSTIFTNNGATATFDLDISCTSSGFTFGVDSC